MNSRALVCLVVSGTLGALTLAPVAPCAGHSPGNGLAQGGACACNDEPPFVMFSSTAPSAVDIPRFADLLRNGSDSARLDAAQELGRIGHKDAVAPLIGALGDRACAVAAAAAWSLRGRKDSRVAPPIRKALLNGGCLLRARAAEVMESLDGPENLQAALRALGDPDARVRAPIARALGHLGGRESVQPLIGALRDRDKHVRQAAAFALGQIGDPGATEALAAAAHDPSKEVRQSAGDAMRRIGSRSQ